MHTYLKNEDGGYRIGQWLINVEGYHHFVTMFTVPSLQQAFTAVNHLNGGTRVSVEALHIKEEE